MGIFDMLFGKKSTISAASRPAAPAAVREAAAQTAATAPGLDLQIPAAAAAAAYFNYAVTAAVTAAVLHHTREGAVALRFTRPGNLWALSGRQAIMAGRQM